MFVKICGVTSPGDGRLAVAAGATHLGVIFAAASPRRVLLKEAMAIRDAAGVPVVGVFRGNPPAEVRDYAASLDAVQLHGGYAPSFCDVLRDEGRTVLWSIPVAADGTWEEERTCAEFVLLDRAASGQFGGTGRTFDWSACRRPKTPFFVAGGLSPENLRAAADALRPAGLDLCSSLESAPGRKDPKRLEAFARSLRDWRKSHA